MSELTSKVIAISVGLVIASILVPMALVSIANATLDGVDASVVTIFQVLLPILRFSPQRLNRKSGNWNCNVVYEDGLNPEMARAYAKLCP